MKDTCLGCKNFELVKIRGQWSRLCKKTQKQIPFRPCLDFEPRF